MSFILIGGGVTVWLLFTNQITGRYRLYVSSGYLMTVGWTMKTVEFYLEGRIPLFIMGAVILVILVVCIPLEVRRDLQRRKPLLDE